jgi:hypothetical protein
LFANLTEALKRRMIQEIRYFWSKDPQYKDTLTPNIQGRYSFEERPQQAIILKGQSASPLQLSADHFQGTIISYCYLTKVYGQRGTSIEWVRENGTAVRANAGAFPSAPGVYYIEVKVETVDVRGVPEERLVFYVDPLLEIIDERAVMLDPRLYEVAAGDFHPGSLRVYEMPGNIPYYEGVNYTADPTTGQITLASPLMSNTYLSVDYRFTSDSLGPFPLPENGANVDAIPGVVLAFGRRAYGGDIMAVVVGDRREDVAKEFGGRWEMSLDMDIMARDVYAQGEITDRTLMFLYTDARERLSTEGIEITMASMGGEAEEVYDENGDDYFYTASISLSVMTDWAIRVPIGRTLTRVETNTVSETEMVSGLTDDQLIEMGSPTGLQYTADLGLRDIRDPWFRDRTRNFDLIR